MKNALTGRNEDQGRIGGELGLSCDPLDKIKIELSGEATGKVTCQVPADPDYLKKIELILSAKLLMEVWLFSEEFEVGHPFSYSDDRKSYMRSLSTPATGFEPISREFLNHAPYSHFISDARKRSRRDSKPGKATEYQIIENVYPCSEPALAEKDGKIGVAFVYFDPDDATLQATEIAFLWYDGENYTTPSPIRNDTRAEFAPTIAFDQNGKIVAAWERVRDENFNGDTIEDMAKQMEIVYAVYDPSTQNWTEPTALSDNAYLDHSPALESGQNGNLLLTWVSNQENELVGDTDSPDNIHYALWNGTSFENPDTLAQSFENCFKMSSAYNGESGILAYTKDMDGDFGTTEDEEIFYLNFDGATWGSPIRLTNDQVADVNPEVLCRNDGTPELMWLKGSTLVRLTDWSTGAYETIREESESVTFTDFKVSCDAQDHLVLLWQDIDEKGIDLFYSLYDSDNSVWSNDLRLTEDQAMEKNFASLFSSDGIFHAVFNRENPETRINDLWHLTYDLSVDLATSPGKMRIEPDDLTPEADVTLICEVENRGDTALNDVPVAFYLGDPNDSGELIGTAIVDSSVLRAGESGNASLSWTIPQNPDAYTVYAVIDSENTIFENDKSNNTGYFYIVRPNLEITGYRLEKT